MKNNARCEQLTWQEVKESVKEINKKLFELIEEINPGDLPIYKVQYPYGMRISTDKYFNWINEDGSTVKRESADFPYTLVLDKCLETFIELPHKVLPWQIYQPGTLFPFNPEIEVRQTLPSRPNAIFSLTSGLRNISFLPLYQESEAFYQLQKQFNIGDNLRPDNAHDHHRILLDILKNEDTNWYSTVLMFDKQWKKEIRDNPKWSKFKVFLLEQSITKNRFKRSTYYLDHAMLDIAKEKRINNKSFTNDMIKQLFFIALGDQPGYQPCIDEEGMPLDLCTQLITSVYQTQTTPIFIEPTIYSPEKYDQPIYHPLWLNSATATAKKSFRPLAILEEITNSLNDYTHGLKEHLLTRSSAYGMLNDILNIEYYSERGDSGGTIQESAKLVDNDECFKSLYNKYVETGMLNFPKRCLFSKALVSIKMTDITKE